MMRRRSELWSGPGGDCVEDDDSPQAHSTIRNSPCRTRRDVWCTDLGSGRGGVRSGLVMGTVAMQWAPAAVGQACGALACSGPGEDSGESKAALSDVQNKLAGAGTVLSR